MMREDFGNGGVVESVEKQLQLSHSSHRPLEISPKARDSHISTVQPSECYFRTPQKTGNTEDDLCAVNCVHRLLVNPCHVSRLTLTDAARTSYRRPILAAAGNLAGAVFTPIFLCRVETRLISTHFAGNVSTATIHYVTIFPAFQ